MLTQLTSDVVVLSAGVGPDRVELARVHGRYLSQKTAASFTGRVIGLYALEGRVAFDDFVYTGCGSSGSRWSRREERETPRADLSTRPAVAQRALSSATPY